MQFDIIWSLKHDCKCVTFFFISSFLFHGMIHKICLPTLALFDLSLTYFAFFTYSPVTNRSAGTKALFGLNVLKVKTFLLILKTYQTKDINFNWSENPLPLFTQRIYNIYIFTHIKQYWYLKQLIFPTWAIIWWCTSNMCKEYLFVR